MRRPLRPPSRRGIEQSLRSRGVLAVWWGEDHLPDLLPGRQSVRSFRLPRPPALRLPSLDLIDELDVRLHFEVGDDGKGFDASVPHLGIAPERPRLNRQVGRYAAD